MAVRSAGANAAPGEACPGPRRVWALGLRERNHTQRGRRALQEGLLSIKMDSISKARLPPPIILLHFF